MVPVTKRTEKYNAGRINNFSALTTYTKYVFFNDRVLTFFLSQLRSRVTFHEHLLPVCLPTRDRELSPGTLCTVIGWGKREDKDGEYL
jgi:corin